MKTIFLFIAFTIALYAQDWTLQLYEKVLGPLSQGYPIVVYTDDKNSQILQKSNKFIVVHYCSPDVEFLVGSHFKTLDNICKNKPLFATSHRAYLKYDNAFGAFYWMKGRPQIHFNKQVLKRFDLKLPQNLKRFEGE